VAKAEPGADGPRRRRWVLRIALGAAALVVLYVGLTFLQVVLASRADDRSGSDAIVVLGAAQYDGTPSPVLQQRLDHALELYSDGVAPRVVLTGGKRSGDRFTEAYSGYRYLAGAGVPADDLLVVTDGSSTWDSLQAADRVLQREGLDRVTLVSDSYHSKRLQGIAGELGMEATVSPTGGEASFSELVRESGLVAIGRLIGYGRLMRLSG